MGQASLRQELIRAAARWVQGWAEAVLAQGGEVRPAPKAIEPEPVPEPRIGIFEDEGPPEHWLAKVRAGAPELLTNLQVPRPAGRPARRRTDVVAAPKAAAPSPAVDEPRFSAWEGLPAAFGGSAEALPPPSRSVDPRFLPGDPRASADVDVSFESAVSLPVEAPHPLPAEASAPLAPRFAEPGASPSLSPQFLAASSGSAPPSPGPFPASEPMLSRPPALRFSSRALRHAPEARFAAPAAAHAPAPVYRPESPRSAAQPEFHPAVGMPQSALSPTYPAAALAAAPGLAWPAAEPNRWPELPAPTGQPLGDARLTLRELARLRRLEQEQRGEEWSA